MFISYAQNLEDVILFRALRGVERGFYIDIGAQDPTFDSVTRAFYERGWRGINVEPVAEWFERLVAERPEDVNLRLAAWSHPATIRFYEIVGTGMSTTDVALAGRHAAAGFAVRESEVLARPLQALCDERGVREVHFLKVDVEGAEAEVLAGLDLGDVRPWLILVESTEPNSPAPTHERWEYLLTSRGYEFVYFDGLNRFYLAREQGALRAAFAVPPNYFDHYVRYSEWRAQAQAAAGAAEREALVRDMELLRARTAVLDTEREALVRDAEALRARTAVLDTEREALVRDVELLRARTAVLDAEREDLSRETVLLKQQLQQAEAEMSALGQASYALRLGLAEERRVTAELRRDLEELRGSRSVRVTKPLRDAKRWAVAVRRIGGAALRDPVGLARGVWSELADQSASGTIWRHLGRRMPPPSPAPQETPTTGAAPLQAEASQFTVAEGMCPLVDLTRFRK